jgi:hypothetical protein
MSFVMKAQGIIKSMQAHTPKNQERLKSLDDFLWKILTMSGMFQKGMITEATRANVSKGCITDHMANPRTKH